MTYPDSLTSANGHLGLIKYKAVTQQLEKPKGTRGEHKHTSDLTEVIG